jgi:hypothetical protein
MSNLTEIAEAEREWRYQINAARIAQSIGVSKEEFQNLFERTSSPTNFLIKDFPAFSIKLYGTRSGIYHGKKRVAFSESATEVIRGIERYQQKLAKKQQRKEKILSLFKIKPKLKDEDFKAFLEKASSFDPLKK